MSAIDNENTDVQLAAVLATAKLPDGSDPSAMIIKALGSKSQTVRFAADQQLVRLSGGHEVGFVASAPEPERLAAIERWEAWWKGRTPHGKNRAQ